MMADEIPVIPKIETLLVNTGNIVNWNRLKRTISQEPSVELLDCVISTIESWYNKSDKQSLQYERKAECSGQKSRDRLVDEDRDAYKVTVKIFLNEVRPHLLEEAIAKVLESLDTPYLETVLLSVPREQRHVQELSKVWSVLTRLVQNEVILNVGVCDLDVNELEKMFNSPEIAVKPDIVQVDISSCCQVPEEMREYAREKEIQLLTHHDQPEILPTKNLQDSMAKVLTPRDADFWEPMWIARYGVLIRCRGIIKTKGYLTRLQRDLKQRKFP